MGPAPSKQRELSYIGWSNDAVNEFNKRFEEETGIKVTYDVFPEKWTDVMQKFTLWGQTEYDGIDLMFADDLIGGMWATNGWAAELSDLDAWTQYKDDIVEGVHALSKVVGGVFRVFFDLDLEPFFYNRDLVPTPPTTWNELITIGQEVTDADEGIWGWRAPNGEGHAFNTLLLCLNQAGADMETLDDKATLEALQFMYDWVFTHKITPPGTVSEDPTLVTGMAAAGKAGMWWAYGSGYDQGLAIQDSVLTEDNLLYARWPKGPAADIGLIHGWGWMIPKASKNKEAAAEYINWMSRPENMKEFCIELNCPPPYKSLFEDEELVDKMPILGAAVGWEEILRGSKFREPIVTKPQVTQLWNMFENLARYLFSGQKTPEEAQGWAINEYKVIRSGD